jgi:thioredoxin-related protein
VVLLVLAGATFPATEPRAAVSWLTIDEAAGKLEKEKKPVLIDLYTSWCGWCKQMDKKTYSQKAVAEYLNDKFYTVRIDAESRKPITWQGKTYNYNPQARVNEFALYLAHGQLEFPTTIFIAPGEAPQAIPGYMEPKDFEPLVKYFGDGAYKNKGFDVYQRSFHPSW